MAPEEIEVLSAFSTSLFYQIAALICTCTLYGFYLLTTFVAFYLLLRRETTGRAWKILLTCLAFVLLTNAWIFVNKCSADLIETQAAIVRIHSGNLTVQIGDGEATLLPYQYIADWPVTFNLIISDCIVTWRVWVLWDENKVIRGSLAVLASANIIVNILDCIFDDIAVQSVWATTSWDSASAFISFGLNCVATLLIALKAWEFRAIVKNSFHRRWSPVEKTLSFMIESGAVYCLLQLLWSILTVLTATSTDAITPLNVAKSMVIEFFIGASALYPMSVVIVMDSAWSTLDRQEVSSLTVI